MIITRKPGSRSVYEVTLEHIEKSSRVPFFEELIEILESIGEGDMLYESDEKQTALIKRAKEKLAELKEKEANPEPKKTWDETFKK